MKIKKKSKYNGCNVTGRETGMAPQAGVIASSLGSFSYCFNDEGGYTLEYDTLAEAKREAKKYSSEHPDFEVNIYGLSSFYYLNGKQAN